MSGEPIHKGYCRCGGVTIEASGTPRFSGYCHCDDCRRSNGAALVAFVGFDHDQFSWTSSETLSSWQNGTFTRQFCKACGAPIAYLDAAAPELVFFYTAFMQEPANFPPQSHSYYSGKIDWLQLADDLPKHDKTSFPRTS